MATHSKAMKNRRRRQKREKILARETKLAKKAGRSAKPAAAPAR